MRSVPAAVSTSTSTRSSCCSNPATRAENVTLALGNALSRSIVMLASLCCSHCTTCGIARVVPEHAEVEFDDHLAAGAVPDAEFRFDQSAPGDFLDQAEPFQHFERRRVRGGGARHVVDARFRLEQPDLEALPGKGQRGDDADGTAAGDHDRTMR